MSQTIHAELVSKLYLEMLDEVFVTHHGIFLDKKNALFETLDTISAAEASIPVGGKCASLGAQVKHVTFYMVVTEEYMKGTPPEHVDWNEIWRTTEQVTPAEWDEIRSDLRTTYGRVLGRLHNAPTWDNEDLLGGALAIIVHTAYHLGEIRQALCTLR